MSIPGRSTFLPVADRFRLRGAANLATRVVFELGDGAQGLPHQDSGRSVFDEARGRRRRDERHASRFEHVVAAEHREVTGEAVGTFHYDGPRAAAHQAFEYLYEA